MFPDVCVVWGLFWGDVPGHARMAEAHASPDPVPPGPCYLLSAMQKLCSWWVPPDLHEKAFSGDISRYAKSKGTAPEFCVYCMVMSITPPAFLHRLLITSRTDRACTGAGRTKEKNLHNQPEIDSLLLNLISPNWIHVSQLWHISFNYSLLMSL